MTWMLTKSGKCIDLRFVHADQIDIEDIVEPLSLIARFNGHTSRPYSVLEHSLIVLEILTCHFKITDPVVLLCGLMHDSHEAYVGDVTQPLKQVLGQAWANLEHQVQMAVLNRFGLVTSYSSHRRLIRDADLLALSAERLHLMHPDGPVWAVTDSHPPLPWLEFQVMATWSRESLIQAFLFHFHQLTARIRTLQQQVPVNQPKAQ